MLNKVVVLSASRTPVGRMGHSLNKLSATELGAVALKSAIEKSGLESADIQEVFMGNVISAGLGQAPARQAAMFAGCPVDTEATTINKVCASGLKAVSLAYQSLQVGARDCMAAGGMESMSNVPFYFPRNASFGHQKALDGIIHDGLFDVYDKVHMGNCAEETAKEYQISREEQDAYAIESYKRAANAWELGWFKSEIAPVTVKGKKGDVIVDTDEEYTNVDFKKVPTLKGAFVKNGIVKLSHFQGTVTAANSSTLNDGASALVLSTEEFADLHEVKPIARILASADAATVPKLFTIAPSLAIPLALKKANLSISDVDLFEINEAFSVVALANQKLLSIDLKKLNIAGGGVSLGHPIGSSGSRILTSLIHLLKPGQIGCAAICNGGGAATAVIIERL